MKVYQIIFYGEQGECWAGDIYWDKNKANAIAEELSHDFEYEHCSICVKEIKVKE